MQQKHMIPNCFIQERNQKNYCISNQQRSKVPASYFRCLWKTTILFIIDSLPFACILFHEINLLTLALYRYVTLMMFCRTERSNFSQNSSIALRDLDVLLVTLSCSCLSRIFSIEAKYCNQFEIFLNFDIWNLYTFISYIFIRKEY